MGVKVQFVGGDLHDVLQILESCDCKTIKILHAQRKNRLSIFNVEVDMETKKKLDYLSSLTY